MTLALMEFRKTARNVSRVLRLERSYSDPAPPTAVPVVEGLRGGVAVLLVAAFEQYVRSFIEESLGDLGKTQGFSLPLLPVDVQAHAVFGALEKAMKGGASQTRTQRLPDVRAASKLIVDGALDPSAFSNLDGNPGPNTLRRAFNKLAVNDVFTVVRPRFDLKWRRAESQRFLEDKLEEVVNRRHLIAHSANCLNISRKDLRDSLRFLAVLAWAIDVQVGSYISALSSNSP